MLARALPVHPYDSALAWTSLFVWYAAWHIDRDTPHAVALRGVMFVQALVSLDHWLRYRDDWRKALDIAVSQLVFVAHLWLVWAHGYPRDSPSLLPACRAYAVLAVVLFYANAFLFRCRQRAVRDDDPACYRAWHLVPHSAFRYCAFWFVMLVHGRAWSARLSVAYWCCLLLLGWPDPIPATRRAASYPSSSSRRLRSHAE